MLCYLFCICWQVCLEIIHFILFYFLITVTVSPQSGTQGFTSQPILIFGSQRRNFVPQGSWVPIHRHTEGLIPVAQVFLMLTSNTVKNFMPRYISELVVKVFYQHLIHERVACCSPQGAWLLSLFILLQEVEFLSSTPSVFGPCVPAISSLQSLLSTVDFVYPSSVDGHKGCFHFLSISNTVVDVHIEVFRWRCVFIFLDM